MTNGPHPYDELLPLPQIAALTGKTVGTIRWYRLNHRGPKTWKRGGRIVAWKSDILEWLAALENSTARGGVR